jgi:hypothetical protein
MRHDAPDPAIRAEVDAMQLTGFRAWMTRRALLSLRRRAYTAEEFESFARASPFGGADISTDGIGLDVHLLKRAPSA